MKSSNGHQYGIDTVPCRLADHAAANYSTRVNRRETTTTTDPTVPVMQNEATTNVQLKNKFTNKPPNH